MIALRFAPCRNDSPNDITIAIDVCGQAFCHDGIAKT